MSSSALRRKKQGQLQISFHFIFAMVGGFLFLLFFFILIRSVINTSEDADTRQLSSTVETIITIASSSPDTFTATSLPTARYQFICEMEEIDGKPWIDSYVRINDDPFTGTDAFRYTTIFAPSIVQGDEIYTLTRTWKAPFPIGSLLMASNNRTHYVLVHEPTPMGRNHMENFIEENNLGSFSFEPISAGSISSYEGSGYNNYRFIFFSGNPNDLPQEMRTRENSALVVVPDADGENGQIEFYDRMATGSISPTGSVGYSGDAMLLGAIFSQDFPVFECNMQKALERWRTAALILNNRLTTLKDDPSIAQECKAIYNDAHFDNFLDANSIDVPTLTAQGGPVERLEQLNDRLLAIRGCPLLY